MNNTCRQTSGNPKSITPHLKFVISIISFSISLLFFAYLKYSWQGSMDGDCVLSDISDCQTFPIGMDTTRVDLLQYRPLGSIEKKKPSSNGKTYRYTIATGASANHFCTLESFLYSLHSLRSKLHRRERPRIVVYNLGMLPEQIPVLEQLVSNGLIDDLVMFDYSKYPDFWNVTINRGEYAWKTGIVYDAVRFAEKDNGLLLWMDSGDMVTTQFLRGFPSFVRKSNGFWSPRSPSNMAKYTHPDMFNYFNASIKEYGLKGNCNGAAIGFDVRNPRILNQLIKPWYECALTKRCIAPEGSSRSNHRQDQSVITYLAYSNGYSCRRAPISYGGLRVHKDHSCIKVLANIDKKHHLYHPSSFDLPAYAQGTGDVEDQDAVSA